MKYLVLALSLAGFVSCSVGSDHDHKHDHKEGQHGENGMTASASKKIEDYRTHDPVCGMEREDTWTAFSVYNNDTVKFCADHCKKGFDLNPEKYVVAHN